MDNLLAKECSRAGHTEFERLQMNFIISALYALVTLAIMVDAAANT